MGKKNKTWFDTLNKDTCESVFSLMRHMRETSDMHLAAAQRLLPPYGSRPAGGAEVDERVHGEGIACYLHALDNGPEAAWEKCIELMTLIIKKHNQHWEKDYTIKRCDDSGQDYVMSFHQRLLRIVEG